MANYCRYTQYNGDYDYVGKEYFCKIIGVSGDFVILENLDRDSYDKVEYVRLHPVTRKELAEHFKEKKKKK